MSEVLYSIKIENLEKRLDELTNQVKSFDGIKEVLIELKLLTTQQIEANQQRDEMLREHGLALAKVVGALDMLGKKQDKHEEKLESLDTKFSESEKKGAISYNDILNKVFFTALGLAIATVLSKMF